MTPITDPNQRGNKPKRIASSFITAVFIIAGIVFAMGVYKAYKPPIITRDSIETVLNDTLQIPREDPLKKIDSDAANLVYIMRLNDSSNKNIARGFHFIAIRNKDSALWYGGKAAAYNEMMHAQ